MLVELKKTEANFATHKDGQARIEDRENCKLRMISNGPQSKLTRNSLDQRRRAEMVLDNTSKFGNVTVGIHGQELPKYAETMDSKTWWRYDRVGKEEPKI